jgi:hypothetical protein
MMRVLLAAVALLINTSVASAEDVFSRDGEKIVVQVLGRKDLGTTVGVSCDTVCGIDVTFLVEWDVWPYPNILDGQLNSGSRTDESVSIDGSHDRKVEFGKEKLGILSSVSTIISLDSDVFLDKELEDGQCLKGTGKFVGTAEIKRFSNRGDADQTFEDGQSDLDIDFELGECDEGEICCVVESRWEYDDSVEKDLGVVDFDLRVAGDVTARIIIIEER